MYGSVFLPELTALSHNVLSLLFVMCAAVRPVCALNQLSLLYH